MEIHLPKKPKKLQSMQAKIDLELFKKVRVKMKKEQIKWDELLTILFKAFLEEK